MLTLGRDFYRVVLWNAGFSYPARLAPQVYSWHGPPVLGILRRVGKCDEAVSRKAAE